MDGVLNALGWKTSAKEEEGGVGILGFSFGAVVTMGYHIDSLDVCFDTQLADSRGDIGVIYA